jgi:hypothetical protein
MARIINLLNQKNHYLEKFYSLNETEILNLNEAKFQNLDPFYQNRESILEVIQYIDSQISEIDEHEEALSVEERREVTELLAIKEEYVNRILAQDLEILSCIESAKSSIIRELQDLRKARKAVGSYKSRISTNRVDEEI